MSPAPTIYLFLQASLEAYNAIQALTISLPQASLHSFLYIDMSPLLFNIIY